MILLIAVLAFLSAAFLLFRFTRRQEHDFPVKQAISAGPPMNARPLFEPTEAELRREADQIQAKLIAEREYRSKAESRAVVDAALLDWRETRDRKCAAELLRVAAESGLDGDFFRAAGEILDSFRESGIEGLSNDDMAALLDSHTRLLSMSERGSGAIFWLKQEVARLRTEMILINKEQNHGK